MTLEHAYQYASPSSLKASGGKASLDLSTSGGVDAKREPVAHPFFFMGGLIEPRVTAVGLTALAKVVAEHFTADRMNLKALKDPVVTCGDGILRFEGFSGCCGLYARLDLGESALDPVNMAHGTTNVDFNAPMRSALNRVGSSDQVSFSVGSEEFHMVRGADVQTERKVPLPDRWVRGFTEAAVFQSRMEPVLELGKAHALRLIRSFPTGKPKNEACWIVPAGGGGTRMSRASSKNGVYVHGLSRLAVLRDLVPHLRGLRVFRDPKDEQASAWEVDLGVQKLTLLLSPGLFRGFSGEGQALTSLIESTNELLLDAADETLSWQSALSPESLATLLDVDTPSARDALLTLGAQGLVGFDLERGGFFHRELPFDREKIDLLNPRLKGAKKLVAEGAVQWIEPNSKAEVRSGDKIYVVELRDSLPHRCNCHWFAAHQGKRGMCKHVLAALIVKG